MSHVRILLVAAAGIVPFLVAGRLDAAPAPGADEVRAGEPHPDFLLPRIDGGLGRLSDHRGKKVILFNFASW